MALHLREGFLHLVALMDWAARKALTWRPPNAMDVEFGIEAFEEAMARHGKPEIFNADQGSQFTSSHFTGILPRVSIRASADGRGRWRTLLLGLTPRYWRDGSSEIVERPEAPAFSTNLRA